MHHVMFVQYPQSMHYVMLVLVVYRAFKRLTSIEAQGSAHSTDVLLSSRSFDYLSLIVPKLEQLHLLGIMYGTLMHWLVLTDSQGVGLIAA